MIRASTPPGPGMVGSAKAVRRLLADPLASFEALRERYGDVVWLRLPGATVLVLADSELAGELLRSRSEQLSKGTYTRHARRILGDGLVTAEGHTHSSHRRVLQPAFQPRSNPQHAATMVQYTEREAATWQPGTALDMHKRMSTLTLRIATDCFFGVRLDDPASAAMSRELTVVLDDFLQSGTLRRRIIAAVPLPVNVRFWSARRRMRRQVADLIAQAAEQPPEDQAEFARLLLSSSEHTPAAMADDALAVLLAGHETTASALTFALVELARNPEVVRAARAEVDEVLDGRSATANDIAQLDYVRRVFLEALRLWPSVYSVDRTPTNEPFELGSYLIPAGTHISIPIWAIHRNPDLYPDPLTFDPDRHLPEVASTRPRHAFMPFGAGRRVCIGSSFAIQEGTLILATILQQWQPTLPPHSNVAAQATFTLRPANGIRIVPQALPTLAPPARNRIGIDQCPTSSAAVGQL